MGVVRVFAVINGENNFQFHYKSQFLEASPGHTRCASESVELPKEDCHVQKSLLVLPIPFRWIYRPVLFSYGWLHTDWQDKFCIGQGMDCFSGQDIE